MSLPTRNARPLAYRPSGSGPVRRARRLFSLRAWSVSHARFLEALYATFADLLLGLNTILVRIGYSRIERPMIFAERNFKGLLFDCRMCGQCILSDTGMSCPMNCPKSLRNGPCGGVRANGHCEIEPDMMCVWVEAWRGSRSMRADDNILKVQPPVDQSLAGSSAWLRATALRAAERSAARDGAVGGPSS
ncbi:MAG: methylenetetrahydrofolate reductase C-terminal domain-containing protein [Fimbriimonadaceae bacterium]|nr:methylenetetrahydrofolate reductase C-terminal domain-containing protein [Alphaproteobacteria bacterium]